MGEKAIEKLAKDCKAFLSKENVHVLRPYARGIGVEEPTKKNKEQLIEHIIGVLGGTIEPVEVSRRGAPVKNKFVPPEFLTRMHEIKMTYLNVLNSEKGIVYTDDLNAPDYVIKPRDNDDSGILVFQDDSQEHEEHFAPIYRGQLVFLDKVAQLVPLDCQNDGEIIILSNRLVKENDLREGDVVTCRAKKKDEVLIATTILTINEIVVDTFTRVHFNTAEVAYPTKFLSFIKEGRKNTVFDKYMQWFAPVKKGQRACIIAPPKAGKTTLTYDLVKSVSACNPKAYVLVLLVDQSPETVSKFRMIAPRDEFVYTTYEDEPERQVFVGDFLLQRAKRYAEMGRDVVLIVDSLSGLAHAYNETEDSLGGKTLAGGMESKTIHYLKKYFGSARVFANGGSLTILGVLSSATGNPADDVLVTEMKAIASVDIMLDSQLAMKRIYPAVMPTLTHVSAEDDETFTQTDFMLRQNFLPKHGIEGLLKLLQSVETQDELIKKLSQS